MGLLANGANGLHLLLRGGEKGEENKEERRGVRRRVRRGVGIRRQHCEGAILEEDSAAQGEVTVLRRRQQAGACMDACPFIVSLSLRDRKTSVNY